MDADPVEALERLLMTFLATRADDRHLIAGAGQGAALVPDVAVLRQRLVLDEDEHTE